MISTCPAYIYYRYKEQLFKYNRVTETEEYIPHCAGAGPGSFKMENFWITLIFAIVIGIALWVVIPIFFSKPLPKMDPTVWWGPKELQGKADNSIRPFQVKFSDELIKELRDRLNNHRKLTPPLEGVAFEFGFNTKQVDFWTKYWANEYNFSEREKFFNQFPQFKTNIQGLDIHFIRVKPEVPAGVEVVPILMLHGWPGSIREFYEAIPLLTKQAPNYDFAFEVVIPSLPGYGFSDGPARPGLGPGEIGLIFKQLMHRLGHKKFYIQGGDWGAVIVSSMATLFQEDILGHHSNMLVVQSTGARIRTLIGTVLPSLVVDAETRNRMYPLYKFFSYCMEEFGYMHIQATKPDTVGVALTDSPVGLLTYILEKFSTWTREEHKHLPDGGLTRDFKKEQLIDNLMVYWSSNCITTSMRLYAEILGNRNRELYLDGYTTTVPTWGLQSKHEMFYQPPNILQLKYTNLLGVTVLDVGGHFMALEQTKIFVDDVFKAVNAFKAWHKKKTEL